MRPVIALAVLWHLPLRAQAPDDLKQEVAGLRALVAQLQTRVAQLESRVAPAQPALPAPSVAAAPVSAVAPAPSTDRPPSGTTVDITVDTYYAYNFNHPADRVNL